MIDALGKFKDFDRLIEEVKSLLTRVPFEEGINQLSLQVKDPASASWYESCGRIKKRNTMIIEPHYKFVHPELAGGYIDQWIKSLDYKIVRTRLLLINPKTCYSIHSDPYPRIHLPIITNPQCLMCFPEQGLMKYLPADGTSYWVDTTKKHTFINCSTEPRIHLVGVVLDRT